MIRPTTLEETDRLVAIATETGVFKPIEIEVLHKILCEYHAGTAGPGHKAVTNEEGDRLTGFAYYAPTEMTDRTWQLYWIFVDRSAQAKGLGATSCVPPTDIPNVGRFAVIQDPQGAVFSIFEWSQPAK